MSRSDRRDKSDHITSDFQGIRSGARDESVNVGARDESVKIVHAMRA